MRSPETLSGSGAERFIMSHLSTSRFTCACGVIRYPLAVPEARARILQTCRRPNLYQTEKHLNVQQRTESSADMHLALGLWVTFDQRFWGEAMGKAGILALHIKKKMFDLCLFQYPFLNGV